MANLHLVPEPQEFGPEMDHYAIQEFINEMRQKHAAEMRVLQNRINQLVQQNAGYEGQIAELNHALDMAENALLLQEANNVSAS